MFWLLYKKVKWNSAQVYDENVLYKTSIPLHVEIRYQQGE